MNQSNHTVRLSISPSQGFFSREGSSKNNDPGSNTTDFRYLDKTVLAPDNGYDANLVRSIIEQPDFWILFRKYLTGFNGPKTISSRVSYAKRYYNLLIDRNFSELHDLSKDMRNHVMKALASLSKYLGVYDKWKQIVERYNLKWSSGFNGLEVFKKITSSSNDLDSLIKSVRTTLHTDMIPIRL